MTRRTELLSVRRIADELANGTLLDQKMEVEFDGKDMIVSHKMAELFQAGPDGRLRPLVDTSGNVGGQGDADIAQIEFDAGNISALLRYGPDDLFGAGPSGGTAALNAQHKIMFVDVVTDGAGDSVVTDLVPALAGYQSCMRLDYIYADGSDGAWDFTVSATSGLSGPNTMVALASVAQTIGPDWSPGIYFQGTADLEALTVQIANGGNIIHYWFAGVYWYET